MLGGSRNRFWWPIWHSTMTRDPRRRTFLRLVSSAAVAGIAGCGASATEADSDTPDADGNAGGPTDAETETVSTATATSTPSISETVEVEMITDNKGSYFDPKGLLIDAGTTVRFINESGSHSTTAYHPDNGDKPLRIPKEATPWDSGIIADPDETFEVTFETPGVYDYYCTPHEMLAMVGRIVVAEPQGGPGTTPPQNLPPAATEALPPVDTIVEHETIAGP